MRWEGFEGCKIQTERPFDKTCDQEFPFRGVDYSCAHVDRLKEVIVGRNERFEKVRFWRMSDEEAGWFEFDES